MVAIISGVKVVFDILLIPFNLLSSLNINTLTNYVINVKQNKEKTENIATILKKSDKKPIKKYIIKGIKKPIK